MLKRHGRLYAIIIVLIFVYLLQYIRMMDVTMHIQQTEAEVTALQYENKKMTIALASYTSLENIDELAVSKLGMIRPVNIEYITVSRLAKKEPR